MILIFLMFPSLVFVAGKVYDRCELAKELKEVHGAPPNQLAIWVCIARHESEFKTHAVGHMGEKGSADHGIFQISDKYWCSPPGKIQACGLNCAMLEDDDITDDFICAKKIYEEHKVMTGDGFNAWVVYQHYCKGTKAKNYIKDCFGENNKTRTAEKLLSASKFFNAEEKEKKVVVYPKTIINNLATRKTLESTTRISPTYKTTTVRPKQFSIRNNFYSNRLGVTGFSIVNPTASSFISSTSSKFATERYKFSPFQTTLNSFNLRKPFKPVGPKTGNFAFSNGPSLPTTTKMRQQFFTSSTGYEQVRTKNALKFSTTRRPLFIFNGMEWYK